MCKTDKELTVEIVNNFITAWYSSSKTSPINSNDLDDLIKSVHSTLQTLPEK